jgi:hypothetical protein
MAEVLKEKGYIKGEDFLFEYFENHDHTEADWAKRIPHALKFIFGKKK